MRKKGFKQFQHKRTRHTHHRTHFRAVHHTLVAVVFGTTKTRKNKATRMMQGAWAAAPPGARAALLRALLQPLKP
jgi:hypothetical protein